MNYPTGPNPDDIYSAGLACAGIQHRKIHAQVYWGHAFRDVENDTNSLQDDGVHFLVSANLFEWP